MYAICDRPWHSEPVPLQPASVHQVTPVLAPELDLLDRSDAPFWRNLPFMNLTASDLRTASRTTDGRLRQQSPDSNLITVGGATNVLHERQLLFREHVECLTDEGWRSNSKAQPTGTEGVRV